MEGGLQRTRSDISLFHLLPNNNNNNNSPGLPTVSEVEVAKFECCGMSEECTVEYMENTKRKYSGRMICGLCGEAMKEEMEKKKNGNGNGGSGRSSREEEEEEALEEHMSACVRFNRIGRAYPALYQADNVRKILKKSATTTTTGVNKSSRMTTALARSTSCIPAITDDIKDKWQV